MSSSKALKSTPCADREETISRLKDICYGERIQSTWDEGPILVSDIPESCKNSCDGVVLGIDEAGRGPVLGSMTYAAAYWNKNDSEHIPKGLTDSKQLTSNTRQTLFDGIQICKHMGFVLRVIDPSEISRNMLRSEPYNLNAMSQDSAIEMIQAVLAAGVKINTAYIDTVGIADSYRQKLEQFFHPHNIKFIVEKKADANYAPCSAASVVAKVSRDCILENWKYSEPHYEAGNNNQYGSGYPSDPSCKAWLDQNLLDPVFCFPAFVRFSWAPVKTLMKEKGVTVTFKADDDDEHSENSNTNQMKMNAFLQAVVKKDGMKVAVGPRKRRRYEYLEKTKIGIVTDLIKL